jgi:hypothetical protein
MGLRFRKSFKIAPGVRMNVGKKGVGVSFGGPGLRYTIHSSGRRTSTVGILGSGISYSTTSGSRKSYKTCVAGRMINRDSDTYFEVIQEFAPLDDLVQFGSGFEFGTDDPNEIHVTFDVNAGNVIPEKALSLTKTGKLSEKALSKTAYFDL